MLQHRNPQIAVPDNPVANPIRVSVFRSVSFCLRLTTYPLVNSLPRPAIHVASPLGYCSDSTRRLPADPQRLRIRTRYEPHSPVYSLGHCVGVLSPMDQTASLYRPAASLLRHQNFPSVFLYASACVSAKTFHDAVPAGSIGKFHHASIASLCCYMITRLSSASPVARMPPLLLRSNTRPRASESSVTFHCIGRCLSSSFAVITRL